MQGKLKFGPDTVYDDQGVIDYTMPSPESIEGQEILDKFYAAVKGYIPAIDRSKMMLDYSGVR